MYYESHILIAATMYEPWTSRIQEQLHNTLSHQINRIGWFQDPELET